jgi:hypothetical protein
MPTERLSMRRIRQVLQLHFGARASARLIAGTVRIGRSTVQDYLTCAAAAGLVWPLPPEQTDEALEQLLFPDPRSKPGTRRYVEPDWAVKSRPQKVKHAMTASFRDRWLAAFGRREVKPVIDSTFPLAEAAAAHRHMEAARVSAKSF